MNVIKRSAYAWVIIKHFVVVFKELSVRVISMITDCLIARPGI